MNINFKIDPEKKLITALFKGATVYEDVLCWFHEVYNHPDFSPRHQGVIDLRQATFGTEYRDQPRKMAEKATALAEYMTELDFSSARWAILVDSPVETSLMMVYAMDASRKHPLKIFSTVEAAEDYLSVPLKDDLQDLDKIS